MSDNDRTLNQPAESAETPANSAAPQWSAHALRRLSRARLVGLLMVLSGAALFVVGSTVHNVFTSFLANGGLTLLLTGLVMIAAAMRTHGLSPAQPFGPAAVTNPRMWFVLLWGAGIGLTAILNFIDPTATTEQILMLIIATPLMVVGGLWILRWISGNLARQWPANFSALTVSWVPAWTVIWAGVWGLISTIAAFIIEAAPVLVLALLAGTSFTEVSRTPINQYETLMRMLHNPLLLLITFLGAVVAAPLIEEGVKALGLRWLRPWITHPSSGWLLGLCAGLGFGMLEGAFNLDTTTNWLTGSWVRLAALLLHGLTTSLTGLGYARYVQSQRRGELWRGYTRAVMMHGLWNASAIGLAAIGGFAFLSQNLLLACGGALFFVFVIVFMILLITRVSKAGVQTSIQEDFRQAGVSLPISWRPMKFNLGWRLVGNRPAYAAVEVPVANEAGPTAPEDFSV